MQHLLRTPRPPSPRPPADPLPARWVVLEPPDASPHMHGSLDVIPVPGLEEGRWPPIWAPGDRPTKTRAHSQKNWVESWPGHLPTLCLWPALRPFSVCLEHLSQRTGQGMLCELETLCKSRPRCSGAFWVGWLHRQWCAGVRDPGRACMARSHRGRAPGYG